VVRSSSQPLRPEFGNVIGSEAADRHPNPDVRFRLTDARPLPFRFRPTAAIPVAWGVRLEATLHCVRSSRWHSDVSSREKPRRRQQVILVFRNENHLQSGALMTSRPRLVVPGLAAHGEKLADQRAPSAHRRWLRHSGGHALHGHQQDGSGVGSVTIVCFCSGPTSRTAEVLQNSRCDRSE
jgi:hypothetical protein